jgi:hypothetical protein
MYQQRKHFVIVVPQGHKDCGMAVIRIASVDVGAFGEKIPNNLDIMGVHGKDEGIETVKESVGAINIGAALEEAFYGLKVAEPTGHGKWGSVGGSHAVG